MERTENYMSIDEIIAAMGRLSHLSEIELTELDHAIRHWLHHHRGQSVLAELLFGYLERVENVRWL